MKNTYYSLLYRLIANSFVIIKYAVFILLIFVSLPVFSQAPSIISFSPTSAAMGNIVTITGTNFTGTSAVSFGGVPAGSFTVVSATLITAVVPSTVAGSVSVANNGQTANKAGFYYLSLSGIITDFGGYWPTTTANNNTAIPDDSHNLLAFTYNGITYSTGVNNNTLTGQGINYTSGNFRSLPVADITGTNSVASIYLAMAGKVDGNDAVANASAVAGLTVKDVMTDGINGLNMGTGVTNLPSGALMTFDVHVINTARITDPEPDILITQIADPSNGNDVFQFIDATGATVGNSITQDMTLLTKLGTYSLDLFELSPAAPFNSAMGFSSYATNTTRNIRLAAFKLSDFGITVGNYTQVAALKITPSGTSDYAFIAFNANAIEMSPNISQNLERTNSSVCAGGTANLEVITNSAYGGALSYRWEKSSNGGSSWSTVNNGGIYSGATTKRLSIVSPTNNYRYRAMVTETGTGYNAIFSQFTIAVITPVTPSAVSVLATTTTCLNNLVSLSCTVSGGSNLFYQWQTNASGSYITIPDALLKTYLPPVDITGLISYRLKVSGGSGCSGGLTSAPAIITVAGISLATPASRCGTGVVSLGASATSGTISWYTASTGGAAIATGTSYSPSISATTTYYVATDASQCALAGRVPVTATINSITWAGTNTTDWSTLANWDCGGIAPSLLPTPYNSVTIPTFPAGNRFPTITVRAPVNNINISTGASITIGQGGIFEIYGAITNNGTFTATNGTIEMSGTAQQTIPANAFTTNTIKNLTINNSSGVLLGGILNLTGTLNPAAGVLTTFGYLTLKSDSAGTAKVAAGSGVYVLGNVNVERYIPARRSWRLMTAPVTNSNTIYQSWQNGGVYAPGRGMLVTAPGGGTGIDFSGNASLKTWNKATQALQAVSNTKVPISALSNGEADNTAYFVFVRGDRDPINIDPWLIKKNITTLAVTGYLQTGTQNFTAISPTEGSFSLIGNPYAAPIDLNLILSNPGTFNIKRKFYVWDPQLNSVGGFVALDDVLSPGIFQPTPVISSQGNYIQSCQAFFVMTDIAGSGTVQVKEANKAGLNNTTIFGRPVGNTESLVTNLYLLNPIDSSIISADGTRADFNDAFGAGIDDDDNLKFSNVNETFGLARNGIFLTTERRPVITYKDTLFLKLTKAAQRSYQFQFKPYNFSGRALIGKLEDTYTGISTQLSLTDITKVNFVIDAGVGSQAADRFRVVFMEPAPLPVTFLSVEAYCQNDNIAVEWKVENELNINKYEVEGSVDGAVFNKINTTAAKGYNLLTTIYNWVDTHTINGDNFYRIKSVGIDGRIQYSRVVKAKISTRGPAISVYPNPVAGKVMSLQFSNQPAGSYTLRLSNAAGQLIMKKNLDHTGGSDTKNVRLPGSIETGNYQLLIVDKQLNKTFLNILVH